MHDTTNRARIMAHAARRVRPPGDSPERRPKRSRSALVLSRLVLILLLAVVASAHGQMPGDDGNMPADGDSFAHGVFGLQWKVDGRLIGRSYAHFPTAWGVVRDLEAHAFASDAASRLQKAKRLEVVVEHRTDPLKFSEMGPGTQFSFNARTFEMATRPSILRHQPGERRFLYTLPIGGGAGPTRTYYVTLSFDDGGQPSIDWYVDYRDVYAASGKLPLDFVAGDDDSREWEVKPEDRTPLVAKSHAIGFRLVPRPAPKSR